MKARTPATATGRRQTGTGDTDRSLALARGILSRLDKMDVDELVIDIPEYGLVIRAVMQGMEAHLLRSGLDDDAVAAAVRKLHASARRRFVAKWLRDALADDIDGGRGEDEEDQADLARAFFDFMIRDNPQ